MSHTSASFGDANNSVATTDNAAGGLVPAYTVTDWSLAWKLDGNRRLTFGVNNLTDARYFTKRTAEYPGPGILPGIGRSIYAGVRVEF